MFEKLFLQGTAATYLK